MYIVTSALISSIGASTSMTMAAMDAQVSGYGAADFTCKNGSPAILAALDDGLFMDTMLDVDIDGPLTPKLVRCLKLLAFAIEDLKQQISLDNPVPLIWLGAESAAHEILPVTSITQLLQELEAPVKQDAIYPVNMGRAGGLYALQFAYDLMDKKGVDYVLLGSAESPFNKAWLTALDERQRLKAEGIPDGFVPGEGAGFMLLARTPELADASLKETQAGRPHVYVHRPGHALSPSHWDNEVAHKGEALYEAIESAIHNAINGEANDPPQHTNEQMPRCQAIVSSLNGELFWMKEHRVALARLSQALENAELYHPFEYTGDLGAFSGILLLAHSAHLAQNQGLQNIVVYSAADNSLRSAALVQGVPRQAPQQVTEK